MESRKAPRINIEIKIISKISEEYKQKFSLISGESFEVKAFDISILGIGIISKYFLPQGLILELEIPGEPFGLSGAMYIKGEIRYCIYIKGLGYKCGIKFLEITKEHTRAIGQFISTYERRKEPRLKLSD
ncbi:MAG: PilZ domain-containing protein [Candidatus Omnitrophica bacterium]|nr:PilZ domain-containing protein [Candidatus Omnitrophota bacterium]